MFNPKAEAKFYDVRLRLELALERFGLNAGYPGEDQDSHFIPREEIEQIESMATALAPVGFSLCRLSGMQGSPAAEPGGNHAGQGNAGHSLVEGARGQGKSLTPW